MPLISQPHLLKIPSTKILIKPPNIFYSLFLSYPHRAATHLCSLFSLFSPKCYNSFFHIFSVIFPTEPINHQPHHQLVSVEPKKHHQRPSSLSFVRRQHPPTNLLCVTNQQPPAVTAPLLCFPLSPISEPITWSFFPLHITAVPKIPPLLVSKSTTTTVPHISGFLLLPAQASQGQPVGPSAQQYQSTSVLLQSTSKNILQSTSVLLLAHPTDSIHQDRYHNTRLDQSRSNKTSSDSTGLPENVAS